MIVFIDNYDSFVYNLVQYVGAIYPNVKVFRNDEISVEDIKRMSPSGIIISPGPGWPKDAGISEELIREFYDKVPILGVCLGHQAIGEVFGGRIIHAKRIMHGKTSVIVHNQKDIFKDLPVPLKATRYHSLVIDPSSLPEELEVISKSEDEEIMGVKHKTYPVFGVQFHPESIATEYGMKMIKNFIDIIKPTINISLFINKISSRQDLSDEEASIVSDRIIKGEISPTVTSAILLGMRVKGESVSEIYGFAKSMLDNAIKINIDGVSIDNCGTGGDGKHTINISTISSFVIAGAGDIKVPKHGNRAVSSKVGSADLLEGLGAKIDIPPDKMEKIINDIGVGFLFAPIYHPSMKNVAPVRKELGIRTIFNILGPIVNPARPKYQLIGVFDEKLLKILPEVLAKLGVERAFVVHSEDGLDEVSPSVPTRVAYLSNGNVKYFRIKPQDFGFDPIPISEMFGGDIEYNKKICIDILSDKDIPQKSAIIMNASLGILVSGLAKNLSQAVEMAKKSISSGKALEKLQKFIQSTL
ncbi:MAG: bifunctional anthranilate synthase component II/anthranilate phosphoribosyltransferase [Brevinematales bacterium]|nr:bifunctional anthranilate synthase component II/anthranilate phosphoribosyltransferase [Brevinematales bacterium]